MRRTESQDKVQQAKELRRQPFFRRAERLQKIDCRDNRRWFAKELRQSLNLVPGLDFFDVVDIGRTEQLRSIENKRQFRLGSDHGFDAVRRIAFPIRPRKQDGSAVVSSRPAADVCKVERVCVDELSRKIAPLVDGRESEYQGFGAQIGAYR